MALKRNLTEKEQYGLSEEEIKQATVYLRKNKTAGMIEDVQALKVFEMYLIGCSFTELHQQFPQYSLPQIILTAALKGWVYDREKMQHTLKDRVAAKVVKSVMEQVDFLTSMLAVSYAEHMDAMRKYMVDPVNNPPPNLRVKSIKEYQQVVETLGKLLTGANESKKGGSGLLDALLSKKSDKALTGSEKAKHDEPRDVVSISDVDLDEQE